MTPASQGHIQAIADLEAAVQLKLRGKKGLLPYQTGFLVTIRSMRGLVSELVSVVGSDVYLLPGRVNQDLLESFLRPREGKGGLQSSPQPTRGQVPRAQSSVDACAEARHQPAG